MLVAFPLWSCDNQICLQMLPKVLSARKIVLGWKPLPYGYLFTAAWVNRTYTWSNPVLLHLLRSIWRAAMTHPSQREKGQLFSIVQSAGRVPTPFSVSSVCYPLPAVLNIYKLPLILPSVPHCIKGRWEVILKLAFVLFLSCESVFSESHSFRR